MPAGRDRIAARVAVRLGANTRGLETGLERGGKSADRFGSRIDRLRGRAQRTERQFTRLRTSVVQFGLAGSGLALGGAGLAGFGAGFLEFDREITKVQTLVGIAKDDVDGFREVLLNLADETGRPVADLARGLFDIQSAGLRGAESLEAIRASALAAAAGLGETKQITEAVTTALGAYKDGSVDALFATDVLLATVREGRAAPQDLVRGFAALLALSSQAGIQFYDAAAAIATLTRTGFDAQNAFTGLRQAMVVLNRPTREVKTILDELGLSTEHLQSIFRERGLLGGLEELQRLLDGTGYNVGDIFRQASSGSVIRQLVANMEEARTVMESVRDSAGATQRAWEEWAASTEGQVTLQLNRMRTTLTLLGQAVLPVLVELLDKIFGIIGFIALRFVILPKLGLAWAATLVAFRKGFVAILRLLATALKRLGVFLVVMEGIAALFEIFIEARRQGVGFWETLGDLLHEVFFGADDITEIQAEIIGHQETIRRNERLIAELRASDNPAAARGLIAAREAENRSLQETIISLRERADLLEEDAGLVARAGRVAGPTSARQAVLNAQEAIKGNLNFYFGLGDFLFGEEGLGLDAIEQEITKLQEQAQAELDRIIDREGGIKVAVTATSFRFSDVTLRQLRRETDEAALSLSLVRSTNVERDKALRTAQLQVRVENEIRKLNEQIEVARQAEATARERADIAAIDAAEKQLASLVAQRTVAQSLITDGTELNRIARQRISDTANAVEQERIVEGIIANEREHRIALADIEGRARRDGEDRVRAARQQLELQRLRFSFADQESAAAQVALMTREAEFEAERRVTDLLREKEAVQLRIREAVIARDTVAAHAAVLELDRLERLIEAEGLYSDAIAEAIDLHRQRIEEAAEEAKRAEEERRLERLKESWAEVVTDGITGARNFGDAVRGMIDEMIRDFIRLEFVKPLLDDIFGVLRGGSGGGLGGLAGIASILGFHEGGLARRGLAVVGEGGPELVDFRRPGRVYTNEQLAGALGAGGGNRTVNVAYNISSTDGPGVRRALADARPAMLLEARRYIANEMTRDGRLREAVRST